MESMIFGWWNSLFRRFSFPPAEWTAGTFSLVSLCRTTLSSLLLGFSRTHTRPAVAPPYASDGRAHWARRQVNRNDVNAYVEDTWKINPDMDARIWACEYELYTPISERARPDGRAFLKYVFSTRRRWAGNT